MGALALDPTEVSSERRVIQEEIAMYESEPWDALEMAAMAELYGRHPYGRPVLGTKGGLEEIGPAELADFHHRHYGPDNAVLVVAGDVSENALAAVGEAFGGLGQRGAERQPIPEVALPVGERRLERRAGETARLLAVSPAPSATHPDYAALRLALAVLAGGRASRMTRRLVDEGQLCSWVSATASESDGPAALMLAAELLPGVGHEEVEKTLFAELESLASEPPTAEELERARRIVLADWIFGHQRVRQQALSVGAALTLFDLEHPRRLLGQVATVTAAELEPVIERWLVERESTVIGLSLPALESS